MQEGSLQGRTRTVGNDVVQIGGNEYRLRELALAFLRESGLRPGPALSGLPARPRLDPALNRGTCGGGGVRSQTGRVVAHLLQLPVPQRHHAPGG